MPEVILRSSDSPQAMTVIRNAIDKEISRLEQGSALAMQRLKQFEEKYQVPSSEFAARFTAEDLEGKDLEYVEWLGEYRLFQQLTEDLNLLKSLIYITA
jgi:hypothetical protein